jgi:hypothetical protein
MAKIVLTSLRRAQKVLEQLGVQSSWRYDGGGAARAKNWKRRAEGAADASVADVSGACNEQPGTDGDTGGRNLKRRADGAADAVAAGAAAVKADGGRKERFPANGDAAWQSEEPDTTTAAVAADSSLLASAATGCCAAAAGNAPTAAEYSLLAKRREKHGAARGNGANGSHIKQHGGTFSPEAAVCSGDVHAGMGNGSVAEEQPENMKLFNLDWRLRNEVHASPHLMLPQIVWTVFPYQFRVASSKYSPHIPNPVKVRASSCVVSSRLSHRVQRLSACIGSEALCPMSLASLCGRLAQRTWSCPSGRLRSEVSTFVASSTWPLSPQSATCRSGAGLFRVGSKGF